MARTPKPPDPERERKRAERERRRLAWIAREAEEAAEIEAIRQQLSLGRVDAAGQLAAAFHVRKGTPGLGFSWSDGHPSLGPTRAALALDHCLLVGPPHVVRAFGVELALEVLVGGRFAGIQRPEVVGVGLRCPTVEEFLAGEPCSRFVSSFRGQPLELYAHTMLLWGYRAVDLARMHKTQELVRRTGGTVRATLLTSGQACTICDPLAERGPFELEHLPSLPLHWGCRCVVLSSVEG